MIVLGFLLAGLVLVAWCGRALLQADWPSSHPRAALGSWLALFGAGLSGFAWVGSMSVASVQHVGVDVGHLLHACLVTAADWFEHPSAILTTMTGVSACLVLLHLARAAMRHARSDSRTRREQRDLLDLVGLPPDEVPERRLRLLAADQPLAYCVAGSGGRIVLSTATRDLLDDRELEAVLAHERAHLAGRHHLLLLPARALTSAAPRSSVAGRVAGAMATLVEMSADDQACRKASRPALLGALMKIGRTPGPAHGLHASGGATAARVQRLLVPPAPRSAYEPVLLPGLAAALLVLPWLVAGLPTGLAVTGHCLS